MRSKKRNRSSLTAAQSSPLRGIDPFDPRYAHVPLDVPISHVEDYVKRKNSRNDQDHLQTQIMYFKKEFGSLPIIKTINNTANSNNNNNNATTTTSSSTTTSTSTQIESTNNTSNQTQNDDHKDDNNDNNDDVNDTSNNSTSTTNFNDILLPSYDSISTIRSALARYEAWQYSSNYNQHHNNDDFDHIPLITEPSSAVAHNKHNNGQYQYVTPFYNPFLRISIMNGRKDDAYDDDNKDMQDIEDDGTQYNSIFPMSHYQQNRTRNTNTNTDTDTDMYINELDEDNVTRNNAYQRYRQYHRYRHSFRALQYHNIRRRLWNQSRNSDNNNNNNTPYYVMPQFGFDDNDTNINAALNYNRNQSVEQNMNNYQSNNGQNWSRISNVLSFNTTLSDDDNDNNNQNNNNNVKLKVVSPKLKHNASSSRLEGLQDFKAATALIPLRLTSLDPFKQRIYTKRAQKRREKEEIDSDDTDSDNKYDYDNDTIIREYIEEEYDEDDDIDILDREDTIVISGIDVTQNLLSQLSSDLHLIILDMMTGLGYVRTMALYKSLSSNLSEFDIDRIRNCSVYKCQALFVERYRQSLFDEKYKALHQPALTRALSSEPRNLSEFQRDRQLRVLRKQCSNNMDQDDEKAKFII